ncbi:hypothetical protein [Teichococcus aestuarii]|uniref:hypothetical protein n=2 Tax=Teichococcus aestuarii TaxID=568898 RepID=UPI0036124904
MNRRQSSWTPERRVEHGIAMRAFWARRKADEAARLAVEPAEETAAAAPAARHAPAPEQASVPVSERTAWTEARSLLLAGLPVVDVARELDLDRGRVSQLAQQLGVAKSKIMKEARNG